MRWASEDTALAIHRRQLSEHGGKDGIRDHGLLQSALAKPQNILAYGEKVEIAHLAAAYALGIAKNHPFIDGNKRTALVVMRTFLILNNFDLNASQEEKYLTFTALAGGDLSEEDLADWIGNRLQKTG